MGNEGFNVKQLRALGEISTIVDVGVCWGTTGIYEAFSDGNILLVEPLTVVQVMSGINMIKDKYDNVYYQAVAAGKKNGQRTFYPNHFEYGKSSFYGTVGSSLNVEVKTLDTIIAEEGLPGPYGIKMDTEGDELDVMLGAEKTLKDTVFVIGEVNIDDKLYPGGYVYEEFDTFMKDNGFICTDTLGGLTEGGVLRYLDLAYTRRDKT